MARTVRYACRDGDVWTTNGVEHPPLTGAVETRRVKTTKARVRAIVDVTLPAIDRCLAARQIPIAVLSDIVSPSHAQNLVRAATRVSPALHARLRELGAPLGGCIFALMALPADEQPRALQEWHRSRFESLGAATRSERRARRGSRVRKRDRRALERLIERFGAEGARELLAQSAGQ